MAKEQKPMASPPVDAIVPDPALETQHVEAAPADESALEELDHVEFYDAEETSLDEPDFDAPEQNAKEGNS